MRLRDWTLQYSMLWAAMQEEPDAGDCICPDGWTSKADECYRVGTMPTEQPPPFTPLTLIGKSYLRYSVFGTRIYDPGYAIDGSGSFTVNNTNLFWKNNNGSDGPMNRCALWSETYYAFQEIGFAVCVNVPAEKTYLIGFGVDNYVRLRLDGEPIMLMPEQENAITFNYWYVYPITIRKGLHILEVLAYNEQIIAAFGAEIYDCTPDELMTIDNETDLNDVLVFSTKNLIGSKTNLGTDGYPVKIGHALATCFGEPPFYRKVEYIPCETVPSENADGKYITLVGGNKIYVSSDFGETFEVTHSGFNFRRIAMSATGQYQTAVVGTSGYIYISSDYGQTWTQKGVLKNWQGIAVAGSGQYQVAAAYQDYMYVSSDYGQTWTQKNDYGYWFDCEISGNGQYILAGGNNHVWFSDDFGATGAKILEGDGYNISVGVSQSGQYMIRGNDDIHLSTDYGQTWVTNFERTGIISFGKSMNNSGQYQITAFQNQDLLVSADYGTTWNNRINTGHDWREVAVNASGERAVAVTNEGYLYISKSFGKGWERIVMNEAWQGCAMNKYNE